MRSKISDSQQLIFNTGTNVGLLAQNLFPGGVDASPVDTFHYQDSVLLTQELIKKNTKIIYESVFQFEQVLCAADILVQKNGKWKCYEVKSSTEVKEVNLIDAALQYYVITKSGIKLDDISIIHINNQYVRDGEIDLQELFTIESVLEEVLKLQEFIEQKIAELKKVAKSKVMPKIDIGPHCSDPYECDFMGYCWNHIPKVSVFDLVRLNSTRKFELYENGIIDLKDVPEDFRLSEAQQMQITGFLKKKSFIDKQAIRDFISELKYPVFHLDFETFQNAVPMFDGTKPYQQIPFQYSLHYKKKPDEAASHSEFLAHANKKDPRKELIENLLESTSGRGTILTYNQSFEISRLKELAIAFPKYSKEINKRIDRIADLMLPFQKRWYYTPKMNGSYSIKAVLPALFPDLNYDSLEIGDGGTASAAFANLYSNSDALEVKKIRDALVEYCKMDTWAMVRLLEALERI